MDTTVQESAGELVAANTEAAEAAALWNPIAAALWSLLLTPAFGAWVHMRNWERLGQPDKARQSRYWFAAMLLIGLGSYALSVAAALLGREDLLEPWWAPLVVFGVWCALSAYPQIKLIDEQRGEGYARRGWVGPVLIGLAANGAMLLLVAVAAGYQAAAAASRVGY
ncbi:MAG: hypothetical protein EOP92_37445 [Lysobacteraceae bacterium]|nr:MAG: hypothetical protein EOP92_37445 [Xanthomonadaceae bacterium]